VARKRIIDTEGLYFDTKLVQALGPRGLHLYIRLWGIAEDWGGYEYNPDEIALKMGALKFTSKEVEGFVGKLVQMGKVIEYEGDGKKIHWLRNFLKNQSLNNPGPPKLPLPPWIKWESKRYESGKTYAKYEVIPGKLPVGYQYTTSSPETKRNETKRNEDSPQEESIPFEEIISYLNEKAQKSFRGNTRETQSHIRARWNEGYRLDDFKRVIDNMTSKWKGDLKMEDYLRPQTLFGTKFESYLNTSQEKEDQDLSLKRTTEQLREMERVRAEAPKVDPSEFRPDFLRGK
jgi:uncharacterized phage protein (TIGR02220 family)